MAAADNTTDETADTFEWTDRTSFRLIPAYAVDEHAGLAIAERFEVIADDLEQAKQYVLDWSNRDSVLGWITIEEHDHDRGIPARRESGVVRMTEEEYYEMRRETGTMESACWVCGPFDVKRMDHDGGNQTACPNCGMETAMSRIVEKDLTELRDGTQFIRKQTLNLSSGTVGDGSAEEIIADLLGDENVTDAAGKDTQSGEDGSEA